MTISFIIPVCNCEAYLRKCVERLLSVQNPEIEVLLVDDGSTDGSEKLCDIFCEEDSRVRAFHQKNKGVSSARNRGLEEATGEYVLFIDGDDLLDSSLFSNLVLLTEAENRPDIVFFGLSFDYYRKQKLYRSEFLTYSPARRLDRPAWAEELPRLYACNYLPSVCTKLLRRDVLLKNGLRFDESMFLLEDLHFSLRVLACANTAYCSDQPIYHYRQTEDEGNAGRRLKRIERISALVEKLQSAFYELAESLGQDHSVFDDQLADIFFMLARQKIQVSDRKTIAEICDDLKAWLPAHSVSPEKLSGKYNQKLLQRKVLWLYCRSRYSQLRHGIANRVKYARYLKTRRKQHA